MTTFRAVKEAASRIMATASSPIRNGNFRGFKVEFHLITKFSPLVYQNTSKSKTMTYQTINYTMR